MSSPNPAYTKLWRELPITERHAFNHWAKTVRANTIHSLDAATLCLLVQWVMAVEGRVVDCITTVHEALDMELLSVDGRELLRLFPDPRVPVTAVYELIEFARQQKFTKLRLYRMGTLTPAQKMAPREFPLFLEFLDGPGVASRVADAQRMARFKKPKPKRR